MSIPPQTWIFSECTGRALGFGKGGFIGLSLQIKLFLIVYSAPASELVVVLQTDLAVLCGSTSPTQASLMVLVRDESSPFSDLSSQQLWALGLGGRKGRFYAAAFSQGAQTVLPFLHRAWVEGWSSS